MYMYMTYGMCGIVAAGMVLVVDCFVSAFDLCTANALFYVALTPTIIFPVSHVVCFSDADSSLSTFIYTL